MNNIITQDMKFMMSRREYQIANEIGDLYKVGAIVNMLQMQAQESFFSAMVYV